MMFRKFVNSVFVLFIVIKVVDSACNKSALWNVTLSGYYGKLDAVNKFSYVNITKLAQYYKLDIQWANITTLCDGIISNFPRLSTLTMISLNISEVENGAFQAPNLQHLSLSLNKLNAVKRGQYSNIKSLRTIYLSANEIEYIEEDAFDDMPWLQKIYVDRNKIREMNGNWFMNSPQIRLVRLSFNDILFVPAFAFKHLLPSHKFSVEYYLDNNKIVDVSDGAVDNYQPLVLHLEKNNITYLSGSVFSNLRVVHRLHLEGNSITCLGDEVLDQMSTTSLGLYLDRNPLNCECVAKFDEMVRRNSFATDFYYKSLYNCPKPKPSYVLYY